MLLAACAVILLVLLLVLLLCLVVHWAERKFPGRKYDERQTAARGNAYRLSFWTGFLYFMVVMLVSLWKTDHGEFIVSYQTILIGLLLQAEVLHTYCLITHSALPFSESPWRTIGIYVFLGALQFMSFRNSERMRNSASAVLGEIPPDWIPLIAGISFWYLAVLYLVQVLWIEKEETDES